ncbi:MAG TPA: glycosyltransferase family 4 protein, partial [Pirellulales bacterium]|nr:glycosyltransferase family 4 protein [Pirellulales bacterium]
GGEVQMMALTRELASLGIEATLWRPWEQTLADADCLHLFGSEREHLPVVETARRLGVRVVLSPIAWFDLASCWREPWPLLPRLMACGKFALRAAMPTLPSWRRKLYHAVDRLLPNSQIEAEQLTRYFGVKPRRIRVVPNGANPSFAAADPALFREKVGCGDFVLYAGRIEPRKNQLGFLRAMRGQETPMVVLGDPVPGHEKYYFACKCAAGPNVRFVEALPHADPLLASAYAACGCLVLSSWYETPGLVALEAAMSGVPLVLPAVGSGREYFGDLASYVSPDKPRQIRQAVLRALAAGRSPQLAALVQSHFSWRTAALATRGAYDEIL